MTTIEFKKGSGNTAYWEKEARKIMTKFPEINTVEILMDGKKLSSNYLKHGVQTTPPGIAVIKVATDSPCSSREDFYPNGKFVGSNRPTAKKNT